MEKLQYKRECSSIVAACGREFFVELLRTKACMNGLSKKQRQFVRQKGRRAKLIALVVFVFVTMNTFLVLGQNSITGGIKVEGLIFATYSSRSNFVVGTKTARFEASIADCAWSIRVEYLQSYRPSDKYFEYLEVYSDGTNIYGIRPSNQTYLRSEEFEKLKASNHLPAGFTHTNGVSYSRSLDVPVGGKIRTIDPKAVAWVISSQIFRDEFFDVAGPVWLAFASKCPMRDVNEATIEPFISFGLAQGPLPKQGSGKKTPVKIFRAAANSERILQIVLYADGFRSAPAFADRAFTNVLYQALAYTNLLQSWIVTQAKMSVLLPALPSKDSQNLTTVVEYEVAVTNIAEGQMPFRPRLPVETFVNDFRQKEYGLISYFAKSNDWLDASELLKSDLVIGKPDQLDVTAVERRPGLNRFTSIAVFISVSIFSLVIILFMVLKRPVSRGL